MSYSWSTLNYKSDLQEEKNSCGCDKRKSIYQISCLKEESKKSCPSSHSQGPECQTNSSDSNSNIFKIHHCCYCKQPHHRMMDHLQSVHPNEPEVAKALTFDKSSQERKQLLNLLQARGNILHNTTEIQSSKQDSYPFGTFASESSFDSSVYCIYCLGLFNKKSFASHLEQCRGKSTYSAEASCDEMLPNAGTIPPTPTLIFPSSPEEIDANVEPSGFHCLNTLYKAGFENEQGCSSHPDLSCNKQPDISSPNEHRQTDGRFLRYRCSPEKVGYELKSGNYTNPSTGQEDTDCNEGVTLPKCDVDTPKSSMKAQTSGTGKRRRKRRSRAHDQSLIMDDDLLGGGEMPNSKLHVCQHCKATFGSPYTLRRHEYTHTGERPFWCHQCNVGFIQKYRLLKHTFACHGDTPDQEKLVKRAKRSIQYEVMSVRDEEVKEYIEPATKSLEDLPNAVIDDTGEKVADARQDTEVRDFQWEEAGHSTVKDHDADC
ncbi:PR domain zinc finger protein 5 [Puntigrus tetrazona]|uniref:PR domain zinc finger protein 5 n=1 Tax=Puntigrus tetrazona TaxID=1606681 RepID=UPI001C8935E9|nr:PR domain zinc finger protein 5 [Puntigrus tetrazona]